MEQLSAEQARRIAVRAQLLDLPRPTDALAVVRRLGLLQVDLTAHVAPSAGLVLRSRLGDGFVAADLDRLVGDGSLVEVAGVLRPIEDVALHRAEMAAWREGRVVEPWQAGPQRWVAANDRARRDLLAALRADGPLPARALPDTCEVPWRSTGWTHGKNVVRLLDLMESRGEVAVASREGRERCWDLSERVWADDPADAPGLEEAYAERDRRRLAALGVARPRAVATTAAYPAPPPGAVPVTVEGTRGTWLADPDLLTTADDDLGGRAALLSPLDRLVVDRRRTTELLGFDYQLEMYKPAERRRWGYWAMPVLLGDRLVGKLDAASDRRGGALRVAALHEDVPLDADERAAVWAKVEGLARYVGLVLEDERA